MSWQPIETAPIDRRIIVRNADGLTHCAAWAQNPNDNSTAFMIHRVGAKHAGRTLDGVEHLEFPA